MDIMAHIILIAGIYILTLYMKNWYINSIYFCVLTPLWGWWFTVETSRSVHVYGYFIILCAYFGVYKLLQAQCMEWMNWLIIIIE
jgi:hypothetical protein